MTFPMKGLQMSASGKRHLKSKLDEEMGSKKVKYDLSTIMGDSGLLNRNRIYNIGVRKKPAELFRKDLISAMKMADSDQLNANEYLLITDPWKEEWEKGVQVPVNPDSLPEANILTVDESHRIRYPPTQTPSNSNKSSKNSTNEAKSSSSSSSSPKKVSKKSLYKFEPERDSSASKYELDLTDHCWLESLKRSEEQIDIPENIFEEIMNELEYQCAKNMKEKHVGIEFDDHIVCDVCRSPDAEDGNEMVFCDLCNICVHQACYGITEIPDGEWLCSPCKEFGSQSQKSVNCVLCPNPGGAFKPTSNGKWAHVSCALWVPEVSIGCVTNMEPITKIKSIPATRKALQCNFCNIRQGAPIQCAVSSCVIAYHVTCAFNNNLKMKAVVEGNSKGVKLKSFCSKHSKEESTNHRNEDDDQQEYDLASGSSELEKNNRFWMYINLNEVNQAFAGKKNLKGMRNLSSSTIQLFIDLVLQYWKLKRTSNCGLPLIKVVTADTIEEIEMARRNDILRLRVNLERIRNLSYMICRREKLKRSWLVAHFTSICKAITLTTATPILQLLEQDDPTTPSSPVRQLFVSDDKINLVKNIINSNVIYTKDAAMDKLKAKRVVKEINRLIEVDKLRKRRPNPYARTFLPQVKSRSGSFSSESNVAQGAGDAPPPKPQSSPSPSNHKIPPMTPRKSTPVNGQRPKPVNGSSILLKSPSSSSSTPKKLPSPKPILSHVIRRESPSRSPSSSTENAGTSLLVNKMNGSPKKLKSSPVGNKTPETRASSLKKKLVMNGKVSTNSSRRNKNKLVGKLPNGKLKRSSRSCDEDDDQQRCVLS